MGADAGEKVGNLVRLFEVEQGMRTALGLLRLQVHLQQHRAKLPADAVVTGGELEMKTLFGIGHAASGQKGTFDKGFTAAGIFENAEIDVMGDGAAGVAAEALENVGDFFGIEDAEAALAQGVLRRELVKAEGKGFFEQPRKALGKGRGGGNNPNLGGAEGVAVEQDAVAFGECQTALVKAAVTELCLGFGGKGHGGLLTCRYPG